MIYRLLPLIPNELQPYEIAYGVSYDHVPYVVCNMCPEWDRYLRSLPYHEDETEAMKRVLLHIGGVHPDRLTEKEWAIIRDTPLT
jgi:hypothetical protein